MAVVLRPLTLKSLQCRGGAGRVFTDHAQGNVKERVKPRSPRVSTCNLSFLRQQIPEPKISGTPAQNVRWRTPNLSSTLTNESHAPPPRLKKGKPEQLNTSDSWSLLIERSIVETNLRWQAYVYTR